MGGDSRINLHLVLSKEQFGAFSHLLQQGVRISCRVGGTLGELLGVQWGIDADYVSRRITTLFINSRAIDDVATAAVHGGAVIALSGAMPGLVGATMRRGGYYAAMRGAMTYREESESAEAGVGLVRVKLFNLLLKELGPGFLARGIILTAGELLSIITDLDISPENFTVPPSLDGNMLASGELKGALAAIGGEEILLTVKFEDTL